MISVVGYPWAAVLASAGDTVSTAARRGAEGVGLEARMYRELGRKRSVQQQTDTGE